MKVLKLLAIASLLTMTYSCSDDEITSNNYNSKSLNQPALRTNAGIETDPIPCEALCMMDYQVCFQFDCLENEIFEGLEFVWSCDSEFQFADILDITQQPFELKCFEIKLPMNHDVWMTISSLESLDNCNVEGFITAICRDNYPGYVPIEFFNFRGNGSIPTPAHYDRTRKFVLDHCHDCFEKA